MTSGAAKADTGHAGALRTLKEMPAAARFVLVGVFVNQLGAFLRAFMVLYLVDRGFTAAQAGVAVGAYSVGAILGVLLGGALSDRLGPRWTIVLSVSSAALFTVSVTVLDSLGAIAVAVALAGAMTQAARPAVTSLLLGVVPPARQVMVLAMYRTALNCGGVAGPLLAAWLSTISWNLVFYVDAVTALAYAGIAAFLLAPDKAGPADQPGEPGDKPGEPGDKPGEPGDKPGDAVDAAGRISTAKRSAASGYLTMLRDSRYLAYLALMLANGLLHIQFFVVLPLMLLTAGYPTWAYGAVSSMSAFVVIAFELPVTRFTQRWPAWLAVNGGWVLLVVGTGLFALPGGIAVVLVGALIAMVGQIIGGPAAFAYPGKVAPAGATGRYIGSAHAVFAMGYAIGPVVGVLLWNELHGGFWLLCTLFGLLMVLPGLWGMRQGPSVTSAAPAVAVQPAAGPTNDHDRAGRRS